MDSNQSLKVRYSETINSDLKKGYVPILSKDELSQLKNPFGMFLIILSLTLINRTRLDECVTQPVNFVAIHHDVLSRTDLLASLMGILAKFRENRYAMSADIEEMFLQVEVRQEDKSFFVSLV